MGGETKIRFPFTELPLGINGMILARVPPRDLNNNCKLVCRAWRDIISGSDFPRHNFLQTKSQYYSEQLIKVRVYMKPAAKVLEIGSDIQGGGECKIHNTELCSTGRVTSSCNGLIIVRDEKSTADGTLQVINLLTRSCVTIPISKTGCRHYYKGDVGGRCAVGLGYDPVTGTYKVVHLYTFSLGFEVFTLNSCPKEETWRFVPGPWSDNCNGKNVARTLDHDAEPILNGRFIHWSIGVDNYIVSFDVSDEQNPFRTNFPVAVFGTAFDYENDKCRFSLVEINGDLGFVHNACSSQIDVYILDQNERVWSKKHSILRESTSMPKMCQLHAVCSLRDGQVLVLDPQKHSRFLYVYDLRNGVLRKLKMNNSKVAPYSYVPHTTSLLHWTHKV